MTTVAPMAINGFSVADARAALFVLDPGCSRAEWVQIGMAAKAAGVLEDDFLAWSETASNFGGERDTRTVWRSIQVNGGISAGTLYKLARDAGWQLPRHGRESARSTVSTSVARRQAAVRPESSVVPAADAGLRQARRAKLIEAFECYPMAPADHPYIVAKRGTPAGLRVVPDDDTLTIGGHVVAGWLAVPAFTLDGELQTVQYIPPPGIGKKLNVPGVGFDRGMYAVGEIVADGSIYVTEGIGQAWACAQADYHGAAVVAFGAGRIPAVAELLRERYPAARIVVVADRGKESEAEVVARAVGGMWVEMPADRPANFDANDLAAELGADALAELLRAAHSPEVRLPLDITFADELPDAVTAPDELVQGVLTVGASSVLYGDSNSGKTFFVIDLAAAIARGVPWMDRQTEPGLVIYLAAEAPRSVMARLQAYQMHHGLRVPNFAIVKNPVNLFDGDADVQAIIDTVHQLEQQRQQKIRLIVGDTLARLSAGANENAGQDMGLVIQNFDRIRTESGAHFMLIHHSGKAVAAGARGWSGIRAAIDTEIEVSDSPAGRCAEITKQRDLASKGERIGFRLDVVPLGLSKWGTPVTSCVVQPEDAPDRPVTARKLGPVEGAILEFLRVRRVGAKKAEVAKHFEGQYLRTSVYRACKALAEAGLTHETAGVVAFAGETP